jgi:hypothetical protein
MSYRGRISRTPIIVLVCASASLAGCAGAQRAGSAAEPIPSSMILTAAKIAGTRATTAYEALTLLRPTFLTSPRGWTPGGGPVVYLDGVRLGGVERLRNVLATAVSEIRLLTAGEATLLYGAGHLAGAVVVTSVSVRR